LLDAGTGLPRLVAVMGDQPFRGSILLTHLHWDHTHGIPFFRSGDRPDASVRLLMPEQGDAEAVLSRAISPPHFAITPRDLRGEWSFGGIEEGEHELEGFHVLALEIPHKGGRTFGYRVSDGSSTIAYLPDHHPASLGPGPDGYGEYHQSALRLAANVDLLIHDGQYTAAEFPARSAYGHSAIPYAIGLAERAGAQRLLLFHHDPLRTDAEIDALVDEAQQVTRTPLAAAAEGGVVELPVAVG
jgi:ribonuclease BN (tRNA processing enzyme)